MSFGFQEQGGGAGGGGFGTEFGEAFNVVGIFADLFGGGSSSRIREQVFNAEQREIFDARQAELARQRVEALGPFASAFPGQSPAPPPGPPSSPGGRGLVELELLILRTLCSLGVLPPSVCKGVLPPAAPPPVPTTVINVGLPGTVGALPASAHAELVSHVRRAGETVAAFGGQGAATRIAPVPCPPDAFTPRLHSMLAECPSRCGCHGG